MSKVKKLVKILNENMDKLSKEDQYIFSDIILNIRYSSISENDAEEFLQQILDATLQAEKEGKNIKDVLGTDDVKKYCDEIISEYKKRYPLWKQILNYISTALLVLLIFTGAWELLISVVTNSITKKALMLDVNISIYTIVSYVIACIVTYLFFKVIIKNREFTVGSKGAIILLVTYILLIFVFVVSRILFQSYVLFSFNFIYFVVIVPILYIITNKLSK